MKLKIYVETTVISLLTSRQSRNTLITTRQIITRNWWFMDSHAFDLYTSDVVEIEASQGDGQMAQARLEVIKLMPRLAINSSITDLALGLLESGILPKKAANDAIHASAAAFHGMHYLLTWNCVHLANPSIRERVARYFRLAGYNAPMICTPQDLARGA